MEKELNECLVIFEIIGLQYFSLKYLSRNIGRKYPSAVRTVFMVVLLMTLLVSLTAFVLSDDTFVSGKLTPKNVLLFAIQKTINLGLIVVECASVVQSFISTKHIKKVYLNIRNISDLTQKEFAVKVDYEKIKNSAWRKFTGAMVIFITIHGSVTLTQYQTFDEIIPMLIGILPIFFLLMIVYKFVFYVALIHHLLEFLNDLLEKVFSYQQPMESINNLIFLSLKPAKSSQRVLMKMITVQKVYNLIYEIGILVNKSLGLTMLILLTIFVIVLTVSKLHVF